MPGIFFIFFSDLPTLEGRTALMVACSTGNKHMVASLIEYSMQLAQRRAARDKDAQYGSLVRVLGHEIAAQARYSEAGTKMFSKFEKIYSLCY